MGLDSTNEDSSTLNMTLAWRGLVLMMEEVCLSMKFARNFTCSVIGLCVNDLRQSCLGIGQLLCQYSHKSDAISRRRVKTSLG